MCVNQVMDETFALKVIPVSGALLKIISVMWEQTQEGEKQLNYLLCLRFLVDFGVGTAMVWRSVSEKSLHTETNSQDTHICAPGEA